MKEKINGAVPPVMPATMMLKACAMPTVIAKPKSGPVLKESHVQSRANKATARPVNMDSSAAVASSRRIQAM
eukprot:Skav212243  [mRNA]  locus=scaffold4106:159012:160295:- [translate_table: standard]